MDRLIPQEANIYFPEMIGCRLAGGNWDNYKKMIERQSATTVDLEARVSHLDANDFGLQKQAYIYI